MSALKQSSLGHKQIVWMSVQIHTNLLTIHQNIKHVGIAMSVDYTDL